MLLNLCLEWLPCCRWCCLGLWWAEAWRRKANYTPGLSTTQSDGYCECDIDRELSRYMNVIYLNQWPNLESGWNALYEYRPTPWVHGWEQRAMKIHKWCNRKSGWQKRAPTWTEHKHQWTVCVYISIRIQPLSCQLSFLIGWNKYHGSTALWKSPFQVSFKKFGPMKGNAGFNSTSAVWTTVYGHFHCQNLWTNHQNLHIPKC